VTHPYQLCVKAECGEPGIDPCNETERSIGNIYACLPSGEDGDVDWSGINDCLGQEGLDDLACCLPCLADGTRLSCITCLLCAGDLLINCYDDNDDLSCECLPDYENPVPYTKTVFDVDASFDDVEPCHG